MRHTARTERPSPTSPLLQSGISIALATILPTPENFFARTWSTGWSRDGTDVTGKTILERRARLEKILKPAVGIQVANYVEGEGTALFELTKEKGMKSFRLLGGSDHLNRHPIRRNGNRDFSVYMEVRGRFDCDVQP